MADTVEIRLDSKAVEKALLQVTQKCENMRPLMKNIAGIMADATEQKFEEEGRPDKWQKLAKRTIKQRTKTKHYPGKILQVEGRLALSVTTQYDNDSAVIGSNLDYARIHQLGGQAGKGLKTTIPARPYLVLTNDEYNEIIDIELYPKKWTMGI